MYEVDTQLSDFFTPILFILQFHSITSFLISASRNCDKNVAKYLNSQVLSFFNLSLNP